MTEELPMSEPDEKLVFAETRVFGALTDIDKKLRSVSYILFLTVCAVLVWVIVGGLDSVPEWVSALTTTAAGSLITLVAVRRFLDRVRARETGNL